MYKFEDTFDENNSETFKTKLGLLTDSGEHQVEVKGDLTKVMVTLTQHFNNAKDQLTSILAALNYTVEEGARQFNGISMHHEQLSSKACNIIRARLTIDDISYICTFEIDIDKTNNSYKILMTSEPTPSNKMQLLKLQTAMCNYAKIGLELILKQMGE